MGIFFCGLRQTLGQGPDVSLSGDLLSPGVLAAGAGEKLGSGGGAAWSGACNALIPTVAQSGNRVLLCGVADGAAIFHVAACGAGGLRRVSSLLAPGVLPGGGNRFCLGLIADRAGVGLHAGGAAGGSLGDFAAVEAMDGAALFVSSQPHIRQRVAALIDDSPGELQNCGENVVDQSQYVRLVALVALIAGKIGVGRTVVTAVELHRAGGISYVRIDVIGKLRVGGQFQIDVIRFEIVCDDTLNLLVGFVVGNDVEHCVIIVQREAVGPDGLRMCALLCKGHQIIKHILGACCAGRNCQQADQKNCDQRQT